MTVELMRLSGIKNKHKSDPQTGTSLIGEIKRLIANHPFYSFAVVLVCVLAYGFFATRYTYHTDSLVSTYYDGTMLIGAGRFVAPLISFVTNWMAFSPFWQTVVFCTLLVIAGLIYAVLLKRESGNAISDGALFAFMAAFVSSPLMVGQLTFPNLNIALSFALVPLALWVIDPFVSFSFRRFIASVLIMAPAIDMYESFAPVFLVTVAFIFLLRFCFDRENDMRGKAYVLFYFKRALYLIGILACAILLEYGLSKIICKICTGTFEFWYSGNTTSHWMDTTSRFTTSLKKLLCYLIVDIVLSPAEYFWAFLYTCGLIFLGSVTIVVALKKAKRNGVIKTLLGLMFFLAMFVFSKSLDLILCRPATVTQMQPIQVFTALSFLVFFICLTKINLRSIKYVGIAAAALIVLLQTQTINNYAVKNQERFDYEDRLLTSICDDLSQLDLENRSVCFYTPVDYSLPKAFAYRSSTNPVAKRFKNMVFSLWDKAVPSLFLEFLNGHFPWIGTFETAADCFKICARKDEATTPYVDALPGWSGEYNLTENTFARKGLSIHTAPFNKEKLSVYYEQTVFEKGEKYRIIEEDSLIYVILITPTY